MGVMSKLLESNPSVATVGTPSATVSPPSAPQPAPASGRTLELPDPAAPCPACSCPAFWIDVYGGGPHCRHCNAPSSRSLVKHLLWVVTPESGPAWVSDPRKAERPADDGSDLVAFTLADGTRVTAVRDAIDHTRLAGPCGRYWPPLGCGPVGDLSFDEWWNTLAEFPR